jgi:PPOX class probable F420-dependent enzyme
MGYRTAPEGWWQDFVSALPARTAKLAVTRKDGTPHVAPVWIELDRSGGADEIVFMTSADTIKGTSILRVGHVSMCIDDDRPPFAFVTISGPTTTTTDPDELLYWGTRIGGRYMGADQAEAFGRRNAVPPEMVVRVRPDRVVAKVDVAAWD